MAGRASPLAEQVARWRASGAAQAILVRSRGTQSPQPGEVFIKTLTDRERLGRSATGLGLAWSLALVSVLIPIAHFVLVPGLLLAGPIVAFVRYRQAALRLGGVAPCPDCGEPMPISGGTVHWPLQEGCPSCSAVVDVAPVS